MEQAIVHPQPDMHFSLFQASKTSSFRKDHRRERDIMQLLNLVTFANDPWYYIHPVAQAEDLKGILHKGRVMQSSPNDEEPPTHPPTTLCPAHGISSHLCL
jgi:hypothetical protein